MAVQSRGSGGGRRIKRQRRLQEDQEVAATAGGTRVSGDSRRIKRCKWEGQEAVVKVEESRGSSNSRRAKRRQWQD